MPEENGDKTGAPEQMEYEGSNLVENSSQPEPGGEEVRDITVDHVIKLNNSSQSGWTTCDITINEGQMEADIDNGKDSNCLIEEKTPEGLNVRKKGTAVIVGSNHKFAIQSRYLSSSPISSCHDSCKLGYQRESLAKISPASEKINRRTRLMRTQSNLWKSAPKEETKKETFLRQLSLPSSIEEEDGELGSTEMNSSKKDVKNSKLALLKCEITTSSIPSPRQASRRKGESQPSKEVVVRNFNLLESSSLGIKTIKTRKERGKEPITNSSYSPKTLLKKSPSMKARLYKNTKSKLSSSKEAQIDVPEKTLYMIKPDTENKPGKKASRLPFSNENLSSTSRASRVRKSKANQKVNHMMQEQFQPEWDSVNPKKIDTITEDGDGRSKPTTPRAAKSTMEGGGSQLNTPRSTKSAEEHGGSKSNNLRAKSTIGHGWSKPNSATGDVGSKSSLERKKKLKGKVSGSEGKDGLTWKVKFKKGTVVALQTSDGSPKKLLFKRGKVLGDDQIEDECVRILKNIDRGSNEPCDAKQPESIQLRHQEASSRKESIDLNIVIEETVSQLVKTRKSKVKALVGAFESVMSLHDSKAMAETSAL